MELHSVTGAAGLPSQERALLGDLVDVWSAKLARNQLRVRYYEGKNALKDFGIAIPPELQKVETVVGWPAKAVDVLAARSRFDGFVCDSDADISALDEALAACKFKATYTQAVPSELINSCSFLTVSRGMEGEPPVIVSCYSALNAAALWDFRRKRIRCGMAVVDMDRRRPGSEAEPTWVNLYTDDAVWEIKREGAQWVSRKNPHSMGRPMMEPLVYRPTLDRPFGKSRISRAVMSITDSAVRNALRSEVSAEFFTTPQRYLLGADESAFDEVPKWDAVIGRIFAIGRDEEGELPSYGQLAQMSMQPLSDYDRQLAARFSSETCTPISELGVIHDNPASAEAIYAAKESLVIEAEGLNECNGEALREVAYMAIAAIDDATLDEVRCRALNLQARFKNPAAPSIVSQADAMVKVVSVFPWMTESEVPLEELGFTEDQIVRLRSDRRKYEAKALAQQAAEPTDAKEATMYEMQSVIKAYRGGRITRKDALMLFSNLGITPEDSAHILDDSEDAEQTIAALAGTGDGEVAGGTGQEGL